MGKKIIKLSKYLKKARRRPARSTPNTTAEIIPMPLGKKQRKKALARSKEVLAATEKKAKTHKKYQKKIEKIRGKIKKLLNNELLDAKEKKHLNRLLTGGIYFMLYEQKKLKKAAKSDLAKIKKLADNLLE